VRDTAHAFAKSKLVCIPQALVVAVLWRLLIFVFECGQTINSQTDAVLILPCVFKHDVTSDVENYRLTDVLKFCYVTMAKVTFPNGVFLK
jgi:hypothetical protein